VYVAQELGFEVVSVNRRADGHPYVALRVSETFPQDKRILHWLTVYHAGVEAEKALYGSYTGDGTGEIEDLAHEFHLDKKDLLQASRTTGETQSLYDFKDLDTKKMAEELRAKDAWARNNREVALNEPCHLFFFSAVDRDAMTRFFDVYEREDEFSVAETARSAPRLGQCVETVYTVPGGEMHHVHRIYAKYRAVSADGAMQGFAAPNGLTQLTEIGEAFNQLEALPTWGAIFKKLGCPPGEYHAIGSVPHEP
jgi:hypothetical protein